MSPQRLIERGFSLVEMALVLLIVGLLAKSAVGPLVAVQEHGKRQQAQQQLQHIRQAVFAHLVAYGALPCPLHIRATAPMFMPVNNAHTLSDNPIDLCQTGDGFVGANELRLGGAVSDAGALLDPWGREYRYVVSLDSADSKGSPELPDWTTPGEVSAVGIKHLASDIVLCNALSKNNCSGRSVRSNQIAFVAFSTANDNSADGLQAENLDSDNYFVVAEESVVKGAEFDDLMVWGSVADASYWLLRMGWLP